MKCSLTLRCRVRAGCARSGQCWDEHLECAVRPGWRGVVHRRWWREWVHEKCLNVALFGSSAGGRWVKLAVYILAAALRKQGLHATFSSHPQKSWLPAPHATEPPYMYECGSEQRHLMITVFASSHSTLSQFESIYRCDLLIWRQTVASQNRTPTECGRRDFWHSFSALAIGLMPFLSDVSKSLCLPSVKKHRHPLVGFDCRSTSGRDSQYVA